MDAAMGCLNLESLTSTLPLIPYQKLTDLYYLSRGGFGTVFKAQHSDWRTTVAVKCLKLDSPYGERERSSLMKEAEVLHKVRFNYIIQIFGICNEPEFLCIVTEYMSNGSLDLLLHQKDLFPDLAWPLRLRILYEIALGVNFLHNMNPPLLHHDLKTQNILLDSEFHVKIADFGLSKWRKISSVSRGSGSKPTEMRGTVVYMPPEEYKHEDEPSRRHRADVKHDMYSFAIIMWEVLSRQIPFEEVTCPLTIMFRVLHGLRPDTSTTFLSAEIPSRDTLVHLMTLGWNGNPDERPSFLMCLIELEPMVRSFDEVHLLEAVLEIKRAKMRQGSPCCSLSQPQCESGTSQDSSSNLKLSLMPRPPQDSSSSASGSSLPRTLLSDGSGNSGAGLPESFLLAALEPPKTLIEEKTSNDLNISDKPVPLASENETLSCNHFTANKDCPPPARRSLPAKGLLSQWIMTRREEIISQMTDACLNQNLDALLAASMIMWEDYEMVMNQPTRSAKVRQLLDCSDKHSEEFCYIVVRKLWENKQTNLQPFPDEVMNSSSAGPPSHLSTTPMFYNIPKNI
ncbi:receptor-interacting serine/threonine-protein kinase 2-like [Synchiropus splendidus]|uniref:receptor-interacting serine/threonine-protein kinase 2-like n=1 Tax=Synchiropus splendidus TaxID=270530 RepID=UPI00237D772D|nr:receptor-interacting serine/threonine-protein kinase 2-like [Synchiropus splendidus]